MSEPFQHLVPTLLKDPPSQILEEVHSLKRPGEASGTFHKKVKDKN